MVFVQKSIIPHLTYRYFKLLFLNCKFWLLTAYIIPPINQPDKNQTTDNVPVDITHTYEKASNFAGLFPLKCRLVLYSGTRTIIWEGPHVLNRELGCSGTATHQISNKTSTPLVYCYGKGMK